MESITRSPFSIMHNTPRRLLVTPFSFPSGSETSIQREEPRNGIQASDVGSSYSTGPPPLEDVSIDTESQTAAWSDHRSSATAVEQPSNVIEYIHRNLLK